MDETSSSDETTPIREGTLLTAQTDPTGYGARLNPHTGQRTGEGALMSPATA